MEERLISFETAELAKEKGFYHTHHIDNGMMGNVVKFYNVKGHICTENDYSLDCCIPEEDEYSEIPAPTQSLLQKWLREKHDITVTVMLSGADYHMFIIHRNRTCIASKDNPVTFENKDSNWEDTLEKALYEALKLL